MTEIDRLIDSKVNEKVKEMAKAPDMAPTDPAAEKVRDLAHMKALIAEVMERAKPEELAQYIDAGHRTVVLSEAPLVVDGIVGKDVTVPQFRWLVRRWINKDWEGTAIYAHARKQYTGRWEVAGFRIVDGFEGKHDIRVASSISKVGDTAFKDEDMGLMDGANADSFATVRVDTVQVYIVWIDAANAEEIVWDRNGKEKEGPQVVVQAAAPQPGSNTVVVMQQDGGQSVDAIVAEVLARLNKTADKTAEGKPAEQKPLHWKQREKLEREAAAEKKGE